VKGETEKMSLEPCSKREGDSAVSSRQLELRWRSSEFRDYCCSSAWKVLVSAERRRGRPELSSTVQAMLLK